MGTTSFNYVQNCLNYGTITTTGTTGYFCVGRIIGCSNYVKMTNCVSIGKYDITGTYTSSLSHKGSLIGSVSSGTTITHCLWTVEFEFDMEYGEGTPDSITYCSYIDIIDSSIVDELNSYVVNNNGWNKWIINKIVFLLLLQLKI